MTKIKKFEQDEVFYLNEKKLGINYSDVENKGARPYVLLFTSNKNCVLVPLMSKFDVSGKERTKSDRWKEITWNNRICFLMLDRKYYFDFYKLTSLIKKQLIEPKNKKIVDDLNKSRAWFINFYSSFKIKKQNK